MLTVMVHQALLSADESEYHLFNITKLFTEPPSILVKLFFFSLIQYLFKWPQKADGALLF